MQIRGEPGLYCISRGCATAHHVFSLRSACVTQAGCRRQKLVVLMTRGPAALWEEHGASLIAEGIKPQENVLDAKCSPRSPESPLYMAEWSIRRFSGIG